MSMITSRATSGYVSGTVPREMSHVPISPARMQRTSCSVPTRARGGTSAAHSSTANEQRSWKRQPSGRAPGAGVRPGMPDSARAWLRCGMESSRARV